MRLSTLGAVAKSFKTKFLSFSTALVLLLGASGAGIPGFLSHGAFAIPPITTNAYVSHSGSGTACTQTAPCNDFADAMNAVSNGGTIYVGNGTYNESFTVTKGVLIKSEHGASHTTINGLVTIDSNGVTINGFTLTNPSGHYAVSSLGYSDITIINNKVENVGTSVTGNIHAIDYQDGPSDSSNIHVIDNVITNIGNVNGGSTSGVGILDSTGPSQISGVVISGNRISNITANPAHKGAYGIIINHATSGPGATPGAQITDNTISGLNGLWEHAIGLEGNTPNALVAGNHINHLASAADIAAVRFEDNPGAPSVTLTSNKFDGKNLINTTSTVVVNSSWSPLSPAPTAHIYPEVYFHGAYYYYGINAFSDVASAMSAVSSNGTVLVDSGNYPAVNASGHYANNITVEGYHHTMPVLNGVNLTGSTFDGLTFKGLHFVGRTSGYGNASINIDNSGSYANLSFLGDTFDGQGVSGRFAAFINQGFNGLTFQNNNFTGYNGSAPGAVYSIIFAEAQGSAWGNNYTATGNKLRQSDASNFFEAYRWQNVSFTHNNVDAQSGRLLIWADSQRGPLQPLGSITVNDNTIKVHDGTGIGIYNIPGTTTVNGNHVTGAQSCLKLFSVSDSMVTGNIFKNCSTNGVQFSLYGSTTPHTASISGNKFIHGPVGVENNVSGYVLDACDNVFANIAKPLYSNPGPFNKIKCEVPTVSFSAGGKNIPSNGYTNSKNFTFHLNAPDATYYKLKYWNDIPGSPFKPNSPWSPANLNSRSSSLGVYNGKFTQGPGTHYFSFSACNTNGCSAYTAPFVITYDNTAPVVHITAPSNNSHASGIVHITGTITDTNPDHYYLVVKNSSGHVVGGPGVVYSKTLTPSYNWNSATVPNGTYTIDLEARDAAGNKSAASVATVKVKVYNKPTVAFTSPTPTDNSYVNTGFTVGYEAHDAYKLKSVDISLFDNSNPSHKWQWKATCYHASNINKPDVSGQCTVHLPSKAQLPDGAYVLKIGAQDVAGNWSINAVRTINVDRTPAAPVLTGPTNGGYYNNVNNPDFNFTWNAVSDPAGPVTYEWESSLGNTTNADGSFSSQLADHAGLTSTTLPEGHSAENTYYWHVRACDTAGNCGAWATPWSVTVDNTAPSTPAATPDPSVTYSSAQSVSLSSTDNSGNTPKIYYTTNGSAPNNTGNGTLYTSGGFTINSTTTVKAIAYDQAGNASGVLTVTYTITSPLTPTLHSSSVSPGNSSGNNVNSGSGSGSNTGSNSGDAGGTGNAGTSGNTNSGGQVLGDSTTTPSSSNKNSNNSNNGHVKGDSTVNIKNAANANHRFLGLGWWWLLVLAIILGFIWFLRGGNSGDSGSDSTE